MVPTCLTNEYADATSKSQDLWLVWNGHAGYIRVKCFNIPANGGSTVAVIMVSTCLIIGYDVSRLLV